MVWGCTRGEVLWEWRGLVAGKRVDGRAEGGWRAGGSGAVGMSQGVGCEVEEASVCWDGEGGREVEGGVCEKVNGGGVRVGSGGCAVGVGVEWRKVDNGPGVERIGWGGRVGDGGYRGERDGEWQGDWWGVDEGVLGEWGVVGGAGRGGGELRRGCIAWERGEGVCWGMYVECRVVIGEGAGWRNESRRGVVPGIGWACAFPGTRPSSVKSTVANGYVIFLSTPASCEYDSVRVPVRLLALAMAAVCASRAAVKSAVSCRMASKVMAGVLDVDVLLGGHFYST
ncbi:hypothetical protein Tco_0251726 [Tanacetum coccineum]